MFFTFVYSFLVGILGTALAAVQIKYVLSVPIEYYYLVLPFTFSSILGGILGRLHDLRIDIFRKKNSIYNELAVFKTYLTEAESEIESLKLIQKAKDSTDCEKTICNKCKKIIPTSNSQKIKHF